MSTFHCRMINTLALSAVASLAGLCTSIASVPGDEHWDNQFGPVGTGEQPYSVAVLADKVYVGGALSAAGNTKANCIAGYDGTNWFPLNNGVSGSYNLTYVFALATDGTNLYAGGMYTNADNCGARGLARWDGTNWRPLAGGDPNSAVETIRIFGTNFFVGGAFTTNGSVQVNGIARWDGSGWQALGAGVGGGLQPGVQAIEYDGINVYAGGSFSQAGGANAANIAMWNGTSWSAMGDGFSGSVLALVRHGGYLYAGGSFTNASLAITNLARWTGSAWVPVGTGADRPVRDLLSDGVNLYAGGDFTKINGVAAGRVAKWNGTTWSGLGAGVQGFGAGVNPGVYKMAFDSRGRLFIAGNLNQVDGVGASYVAGWDGAKWFSLGGATSKGMTHYNNYVQGLYSDGLNLYAGGGFTEGGDVIVNGVAKWDGSRWSALGSVVNGQLPSLMARAFVSGGGCLYAGGSFTTIGGVAAGRIAQWDGYQWYNIGDADGTVRALLYDGYYVWMGGSFTNIAGGYSPGLAMYVEGSGWYTAGNPAGGGQLVNAIADDGTYYYVAGNFTSMDAVSAVNIARFDGYNWSPLGAGLNGTVNALAVVSGSLYAGGSFTASGATTLNRIARWNGSSWSALGSGLTGSSSSAAVTAIVASGANLYVGGSFTNAGTVYLAGIAKWDGTAWSALGSGLYNGVFNQTGQGTALALMGSDLYVGGQFTTAGDKPSISIGRWNDQLNFYPPPHPYLTRQSRLTNGQFRFRLAGTSGERYVLQASTNLSAWTPLLTNSATLFDFTDTTAPNYPWRCYRAVLAP